MARLFSGRAPVPSLAKVRTEPGLRNLEQIVNPDMYVLAKGNIFVQPGGIARAWSVNTFAELPVFGGKFFESAAQQIGYRTPS